MLTRSGIATLILGGLAIVAGRVFGIFELWIIALATLGLLVCALVWVLLNRAALSAARTVTPPKIHVGDETLVTLSLTNRRWFPTSVAQITDEAGGEPKADAHVPPLRRNHPTRASYRLQPSHRGLIALGPMTTTCSDPFGLAVARRRGTPDTNLLVLPAYEVVIPAPPPSGRIASRTDRDAGRIGPHGDEFSSLRSYVVGDDLRKVHWKSSARTGDLVVKTEHAPEHGHTVVILDNRKHVAAPEIFERMVSAATSIVIANQRNGDDIDLVIICDDESARVAAKARSAFDLDRLLERLALVEQRDARGSIPPGHNAGTSILVCGDDPELAGVEGNAGLARDSIVVSFPPSAPRTRHGNTRLPSMRMVQVGPAESFAELWTVTIGGRVRS